MSEVTVKQFAESVGTPVDRLITQLSEAGVEVSGSDSVLSDDDKATLLAYLRRVHGHAGDSDGVEPSRITLRRKSRSQIKLSAGSGAGRGRGAAAPGTRTVNVEVRKKRTYIKRSVADAEREAQEAQEAPAVPPPGELEAAEAQLPSETALPDDAVDRKSVV